MQDTDLTFLLHDLIEKNFYDLKKYKIKIKSLKILKKTFMITLPFSNNIFYNKKLINKCNKNILKAVLLHELFHIKQFKRKNFFQKIFFIPRYHIDDKFRVKHELEAHKMVVKKGYGQELLILNDFVKNRYSKKCWDVKLSKYYLSKKSIHKLMKNCEKNYDS